MTTHPPTTATSDLKQRHRAMWASGDYPTVAELITSAGESLVDALHVSAGERVVDVAAGAGNAAAPAARAGAHVVATDLTPELLEEGARRHDDLPITWRTADAEDMPFDTGTFDVAMSCVGVMFAPDHQRCADELVRVCRPGGRVGVLSWTPSGFIGQLFTAMKPYAPAPPPHARPPALWGVESHVRELFGPRLRDIETRTQSVVVDQFDDGAAFRDLFKSAYGPAIATFANIADDAARVRELDTSIADFADRNFTDGTMSWEYLIVTGTVA